MTDWQFFFAGGGGGWGGGGVYRVQIVNSNFQPLVGGTCMVRVVVNICGLTNK